MRCQCDEQQETTKECENSASIANYFGEPERPTPSQKEEEGRGGKVPLARSKKGIPRSKLVLRTRKISENPQHRSSHRGRGAKG